jgi:hypothetical protein
LGAAGAAGPAAIGDAHGTLSISRACREQVEPRKKIKDLGKYVRDGCLSGDSFIVISANDMGKEKNGSGG